MRNFMERNNIILRIILPPLAILIGLGLMSYFGVETKIHAAETYLRKETARADYLDKKEADAKYVKTEVHQEKERREDERWEDIKKSLDAIKKKINIQ